MNDTILELKKLKKYYGKTKGIENVSIPLTQKSVDIKLDYKNINETKKMIDKKPLTKDDITNLSIAGVVFVAQIIIFILIIVDLFKLGDKKSKYDIYISLY